MNENITKKMEKSYFDVLGVCCSSEVPLIEKILKPIEGVRDVSVIVPSRTVIVVHDPLLVSQLQIVKALNEARLEANVRVKGETNYRNKWPSPFAVACGVLLLLSFLSYVYSPFKWLALAAVAVGIIPIVLKSVASLRNFRLDVNTLMLIAVGGSIFLKDYWEAGTIVFLFTTAEWLESRASHKATAVMSSLMNMAPQKAVLASNGEQVNASEVMVNTKLAVKAGDCIPIDGIVVQGKCEVDEKSLTGESFPVSKQVDSTVWAGTINLNGYISINTTVLAEDCVVARMAKLVEEAQNKKCKTQRYIDECAKYYTPAVVVVAACLAAVPASLKLHNLDEWYHLALVVLVSSCPCALILSTPVATFCALTKAATTGLLIKGAEYLETLSKVKIIAFDKTGTITKGEFSVSNFQSLIDDVSLDKLLYWVSSIESKSSHPMASALIDYAQSHSVTAQPDNVEEFENYPGEGIYGKIEGENVYVGNQKIAIRAGYSHAWDKVHVNMEGRSTGYIFVGTALAGVFSLSDSCRTGAKEALKELKSMGIKTAMLTGDCQSAANHAQNQLGETLEIVHAGLLPQDKAKFITDFQKMAPTAMVGDGINDAPALATADIGISMGISGSALATETGQVILMSNDIRKIPIVVRIARKTRRKIFENIFLAIITKVAIIALAIAGHPLVWAAVLADVGTCLIVILNSMLLLRTTTVSKSTKHHSGSSHTHRKHCHSKKSSDVGQKKGCCDHEHKEQEPKQYVQSIEDKHSCCAHDGHAHKVNHAKHEREDTHGHNCVHDNHIHEVKNLAQELKQCGQGKNIALCAHDHDHDHDHDHEHEHEHEHAHVVNYMVEDIKGTHNCCGHSDNEVNEVKHKVEDKKIHGGCGHEDHQASDRIIQVLDNKNSDMESHIRSRSCDINIVNLQNNCCHDQITHKKSHSSHETHSHSSHGHVKEYTNEEELRKMVRRCCENHEFEKMNVGGCCRSFRKEGCGHQHFAGLSEIVID
ncbi:putative inactive cadmium/zinc-transporting ATPase HMA3 [Rutidosis leptorrhynchoides]|uniref:putative inactive cadmium/zinc-transporting ATPase HMA3 n=1 Tax=Rutidosis leptorrhynchoides TaxID=125765 RepID=UPI003A999851